MKYFVINIVLFTLINSGLANSILNDEECYPIAIQQMLNGNYEKAIESFEMVLAANPTHCESLSYTTECYLGLLLLAECKEDALKLANKVIEYADRSEGDFIEDGKPVYYSILAKNQAALWGYFYDDFCNAEYQIFKHFELYGNDILGWYTLGDYYLTCSYFPERQALKTYNNEVITNENLFEVSLDCLIEDARDAFTKCTEYNKSNVLGNYGLMEIALYNKNMEELRKQYASISHKNYAPPLEATLQYFALALYDDCLIDDFYDHLDIYYEEIEINDKLIGSYFKN